MAKRRKRSERLILRDKLDAIVSKCVRLSAADSGGFVECYTCGLRNNWKHGMDCGHWISRAKWPTRWHHDNLRPQCMRCNRVGRRGDRNPQRVEHTRIWVGRYVGPGEPDVFEVRLRSEGIDTEALTELSRGPQQGIDELREMLEFYTECWSGLLEKRLDCDGVQWEKV